MGTENRFFMKPLTRILLYLGIFFGNWFLADILFTALYQVYPASMLDMLLNEWGLWIVFKFILPLFIIMLVFRIRRVRFFQFCQFNKMSRRDILIILLIAVLGSLFTIHLSNTSFALEHVPEFNQYIVDATKGNLFSTFVVGGFLLVTCEEILFRGLLFNELRQFLPLTAVLFLHFLVYMPLNPNLNVAIYASFNFLVYALVFIFVKSLWGSILFQALGAMLLFAFHMLGFDQMIRGLGDVYLFAVVGVSLILLLYLVFSLKKAPMKTIFASRRIKIVRRNLYEEIY